MALFRFRIAEVVEAAACHLARVSTRIATRIQSLVVMAGTGRESCGLNTLARAAIFSDTFSSFPPGVSFHPSPITRRTLATECVFRKLRVSSERGRVRMTKKKDESPPPVMRTNPTWQPGMSISAKPVLPALPESEEMQTELLDDLERMGCLGFTKVAWDKKTTRAY